ncbi:MAG: type II secretion system F family protein [Johnsonella sp.]|nr:type II secretion system F family protein [Johnsonella sp.]
MTDYSIYHYSVPERMKYISVAFAAEAVISYVFYRSILIFLILAPFSLLYPELIKKNLIQKRRKRLEAEFKEGIWILSSLLSAGYSIENAVEESVSELRLLYGKKVCIISEFEYISHRIRMNIPVEKAFEEFGERSGSEDIRNFARVIKIAKRSGGELVSVIAHTASVISDKIRIKEEILTMTTAKRYEQKIMNLLPVLIVIYVDASSPGFFDLMYTSFIGRIMMSVCLGAYLFALYLSGRILNIEV